ncbi:MAG: S-adenosylmethionine decarboxylase [Candidatus Levybacteria bacterium]|nr:S-adenosylmethionine decarboxylase [Candidatus Levybacteria bacterium]
MTNKNILNINPALKLERSWLEAELKPASSKLVTAKRVKEFQIKLATICNMHVFCGPMVISPDSNDSLLPYKTNKKFKPQDWNAYTWWTRKDAPNVLTVLDHSHESFYYYPDHNLIDVSIATCNTYDLKKVLEFVHDFWQPNKEGIRYAFLSPNKSACSWKIFIK